MMSTRNKNKRRNVTATVVRNNDRPAPVASKPRAKAKPKTTKVVPRSRLCSVVGCTRQVQQGGVCCRHGAKTTRALCSHGDCNNVAKRGGLCRRHGAFELETCAKKGCKYVAKHGEFCDTHSPKDSKAAGEAKRAVAKRKIYTREGGAAKKRRVTPAKRTPAKKRATPPPLPPPSPPMLCAPVVSDGSVDRVEFGNDVDTMGGSTDGSGSDLSLGESDQHSPHPAAAGEVAVSPEHDQFDFLCDFEDLYQPLT